MMKIFILLNKYNNRIIFIIWFLIFDYLNNHKINLIKFIY